jgi:hypothetical protein
MSYWLPMAQAEQIAQRLAADCRLSVDPNQDVEGLAALAGIRGVKGIHWGSLILEFGKCEAIR